jgi:hypothetical protein
MAVKFRCTLTLTPTEYEHVYKSTEAALAASKFGSKCSHTPCMLRFFAAFCLAIIGLIEFIEMP